MGLFLSFAAVLGAAACWAARMVDLPDALSFLRALAPLPAFSGTALALLGLLSAFLVYRRRKGKKRRLPMLLMVLCTMAAIFATLLWINTLLPPGLTEV